MPYLSPDAKAKLSTTIRSLRERLLTDLPNAAESTYRFSIHLFSKKQLEPRAEVEFDPKNKAGLLEEGFQKRLRIEQWLYEQVRAETGGKALKDEKKERAIWDRHLYTAIKLAAATLLNRLIVIHQLEALGLMRYKVVTGGWSSSGYRGFRDFAPDLCKDDTEGYGALLQLLYDELALEMPGLFGRVGLTELLPIPASTLRAVVEALDALEPDTWLDDTTLGWVYQFWNDSERKALDDKVSSQNGKIENHEIAAKTQIFTERYMVEWILQNSLNQQWLAICEKNGWTLEVKASGILAALEARRMEWQQKRETGEVTAEEMMPLNSDEEHRWKYWVSQPLSKEFVETIPSSLRDLKILDPAVGSGHFLIIAFSLLTAFYEEEARHRSENWTSKQIAEWIIERNLHGVDIDPRAVQIAAASLYVKAKSYCKHAEPRVINLVASNLNLSELPKDDPAVLELKQSVFNITGIPEELTEQILQSLKGADYLGALLKVDEEVNEAICQYEAQLEAARTKQMSLLEDFVDQQNLDLFNASEAKISLLKELDKFLAKFSGGDDLGLRLRGEQLAAGVRFVRLIQNNQMNLVFANPPYLGGGKIHEKDYVDNRYLGGKGDLYAAFLQRGVELAAYYGLSAMVTMRGWLFIKDYEDLRYFIATNKTINKLVDLHFGAFPEMKDVSVTMSVLCNKHESNKETFFIKPVRNELVVRDINQVARNISGLIAPCNIFCRPLHDFKVIAGQPFIYWWSDSFLEKYSKSKKLGKIAKIRQGMATANNPRFLRNPWEVESTKIRIITRDLLPKAFEDLQWTPFIKGAAGREWFVTSDAVIDWSCNGLEHKVFHEIKYSSYTKRIPSENFFFKRGIAFTKIGSSFCARVHRLPSIFSDAGSSVFTEDLVGTICLLNSSQAREILQALNPTVNFQVGDVNRLPYFRIELDSEIFSRLSDAFTAYEAVCETSLQFKQPGASCWQYAQQWAQQAVDRPAGAPLPKWNPVYEEPPAVNWVSYAIGVALGRFGVNGEGILPQAPETALPNGILYLSAYSGDQPDSKDSLNHSASQPIKDNWNQYGSKIAKNASLRDWLRLNFFKDIHVKFYEQRPIYFPLSSKNKNFVAFVSIHRWTDNTLQTLLADYLMPELSQLEGEVADLLEAKGRGESKAQAKAEKRYTEILQLRDELKTFISLVQQCAEQGAPKANPKDPDREANARFTMDLDDGVMVNSAALWCLLDPQWNKPKTWWSELCTAQGKKDYDWSHLAARYFPDRVDANCQIDPSLAVAHGCFWKYHPAKAYEWELRLQDEIAPDFTIDEANSDALRQQFEDENPERVADLKEKEEKRRERKRKKQDQLEMDFDEGALEELEEDDES